MTLITPQQRHLDLDELTNRVAIATNHPDAETRRAAKRSLAEDAGMLVEAAKVLYLQRLALAEENEQLRKALNDHAIVVAAFLDRAGGEFRVDRGWLDGFVPTGGWDTDETPTEVVFRLISEAELEARRTAEAAQAEKEGA